LCQATILTNIDTEIPQRRLPISPNAVKRSRRECTRSFDSRSPIPVDSVASGVNSLPSKRSNPPSTGKLDVGGHIDQDHSPVGQEAMSPTDIDDHTACQVPDMVMASNNPPTFDTSGDILSGDILSGNLSSTPTQPQNSVTVNPAPIGNAVHLPFEEPPEFSTLFTHYDFDLFDLCEEPSEFSMFYTTQACVP